MKTISTLTTYVDIFVPFVGFCSIKLHGLLLATFQPSAPAKLWMTIWCIGFPTEFCSKRVSRNRDETNFVITQHKVVILRNSVLWGMAYFVARNGREQNEIRQKSRSLWNKRTMLKFFVSKASLIFENLLSA